MNEHESIPSFEIAEFRYLADMPAPVVDSVLSALRLRGFQASRDALYHPGHWKVLSIADAGEQGLSAYLGESEAFVPVSDDAKAWLAAFRGDGSSRGPDQCRRCSECPDSDHHWIDGGPADDCPHGAPSSLDCKECLANMPDFVCKHCPATAVGCEMCDGLEPDCRFCGATGAIEILPPEVPEDHRAFYLAAVKIMPRADALAAVADSVRVDRALVKLGCPVCGGPIGKTLDPRQAGPSSNNGVWYNYRCAGCRYAIDKAEVD